MAGCRRGLAQGRTGAGGHAISDIRRTTPPAAPALAAHTRRAYAADWQAFAAWCHAQGQPALPAAPAAVAAHLTSLAGRLGRSGLRRRLAAIADHHRRHGQAWEARHPTIQAVLRQLMAGAAAPSRPAATLSPAALATLLASCGGDLAGLRDRALLRLAQATALRRAALVALDREQVRVTPEGMTLETTDGVLAVARSPDPACCPVRAMEAWLRRARIEYGAVFRRVTAAATLEDRLSPQGVWKILRRRAALAKLAVPAGERLSLRGLSPSGPVAAPPRRHRPPRRAMA